MTRRLLELVDEYGYRSVASRDPERLAGTVAVDVPEAARVAKALNARDFVVDYRPGVGIRLSPHFYNTMDEVDAMMRELDRVARMQDCGTGHEGGARPVERTFPMRALTLCRGRLQLADVPVPDRPGECLVRVLMAGICGTDLELVRGYADFMAFRATSSSAWSRPSRSPKTATGWASASSATSTSAAARAGRAATASRSTAKTVRCSASGGATAPSRSTSRCRPATSTPFRTPWLTSRRSSWSRSPPRAGSSNRSAWARARVAVMGDGRMGLLLAQVVRRRRPGRGVRPARQPYGPGARHGARRGGVARRPAGPGRSLRRGHRGHGCGRRPGRALDLVRPRGTIVLSRPSTIPPGCPRGRSWLTRSRSSDRAAGHSCPRSIFSPGARWTWLPW